MVAMAMANPWYGYKRIAVMCRREGQAVKDREAYVVMKDHGFLQKRKTRRAEVYQAAKLFELLPQGPNDLWQMDVTYIHIPGLRLVVRRDGDRLLLAVLARLSFDL